MSAREEILDRIRSALADRPQPAPVERAYRTAGESWIKDAGTKDSGIKDAENNDAGIKDAGTEDDSTVDSKGALLELLVDRLVDYRATVHRATPETAAEVIAAALAERGATRVVVPDGFPAQLLAAIDPVTVVRDEPPLSAAELDVIDGVLTTSTVAIAESGTIVLAAGPGQGRRALSLVPDYHLCVVLAADVVQGVPEGIARLAPENPAAPSKTTAQPRVPVKPGAGGARPLTWISGPSATSDIELQRVEGVHGPRTLAVVLVS
jgi:L-lactate dehydrogenase complex protein LldG